MTSCAYCGKRFRLYEDLRDHLDDYPGGRRRCPERKSEVEPCSGCGLPSRSVLCDDCAVSQELTR